MSNFNVLRFYFRRLKFLFLPNPLINQEVFCGGVGEQLQMNSGAFNDLTVKKR